MKSIYILLEIFSVKPGGGCTCTLASNTQLYFLVYSPPDLQLEIVFKLSYSIL